MYAFVLKLLFAISQLACKLLFLKGLNLGLRIRIYTDGMNFLKLVGYFRNIQGRLEEQLVLFLLFIMMKILSTLTGFKSSISTYAVYSYVLVINQCSSIAIRT